MTTDSADEPDRGVITNQNPRGGARKESHIEFVLGQWGMSAAPPTGASRVDVPAWGRPAALGMGPVKSG